MTKAMIRGDSWLARPDGAQWHLLPARRWKFHWSTRTSCIPARCSGYGG